MKGVKNQNSKSKVNTKNKKKNPNTGKRPIIDTAFSESITQVRTIKPKLKTKSPTNSPIFTYKLPPAFSINSLKSFLTKSKGNKSDSMSDKILDMLIGTTTTLPPTTSTTTATTTTTTSSTSTQRIYPKKSLTNSPIYTYKLPPVFSMNSLRSLLGKNKDDK